MERHIDISRFDYDLPDERIAKFPLAERSASKLLVWRGGEIAEKRFADIGDVLPAGELLVFNNTKVIRARIVMHKLSGARIEVFCLEPHDPADYERAFAVTGGCTWSCIVGNRKKWKEGYVEINFERGGCAEHLRAWIVEDHGRECVVRFEWTAPMTFGQLLEYLGRIPIPPYLNRESEEIDNTRYQTVYSRELGSAAAPTAGLHFTKELLQQIAGMGVKISYVTLHVGLGTFRPVKEDEIEDHPMHSEFCIIPEETARMVNETKANGGRVVCIGTTSCRTVESFADADGTLRAQSGWTDIFIYPGYKFKAMDALITNFHLPESTLVMLVSAFADREKILNAYNIAVQERYRFFSFGDAMFIGDVMPSEAENGEKPEK